MVPERAGRLELAREDLGRCELCTRECQIAEHYFRSYGEPRYPLRRDRQQVSAPQRQHDGAIPLDRRKGQLQGSRRLPPGSWLSTNCLPRTRDQETTNHKEDRDSGKTGDQRVRNTTFGYEPRWTQVCSTTTWAAAKSRSKSKLFRCTANDRTGLSCAPSDRWLCLGCGWARMRVRCEGNMVRSILSTGHHRSINPEMARSDVTPSEQRPHRCRGVASHLRRG
jgi:hypothetical protein